MRLVRILFDYGAGYGITGIRRFGKVLAEAGSGVVVSAIPHKTGLAFYNVGKFLFRHSLRAKRLSGYSGSLAPQKQFRSLRRSYFPPLHQHLHAIADFIITGKALVVPKCKTVGCGNFQRIVDTRILLFRSGLRLSSSFKTTCA